MKTIVAAAALALLIGGAASAQEHSDHPPAAPSAATGDAALREQCKAHGMGGQTPSMHGHASDTVAAAPHAGGMPMMSPDEMKMMHQKCQAMMAKEASTAEPPAKPKP